MTDKVFHFLIVLHVICSVTGFLLIPKKTKTIFFWLGGILFILLIQWLYHFWQFQKQDDRWVDFFHENIELLVISILLHSVFIVWMLLLRIWKTKK